MKNLNKAQSQFLIYLGGHGKPDSDELYELIELAKSLEIPNKIIGEMRVFRDKLAQVSAKKGELEEAKQEAIDQWGVVRGVAETDGDLVDQAIEAELDPLVKLYNDTYPHEDSDAQQLDVQDTPSDNENTPSDKGFDYYDPTLPTSPHDYGARFMDDSISPPPSYHVEKHPFGLTYRICRADYQPDGNHIYRTVQLGNEAMFDTPQEAFDHLMAHAKQNNWAMIVTVEIRIGG